MASNNKDPYNDFSNDNVMGVDTSWNGINGENIYGLSTGDPYTSYDNLGYGDDYESQWEEYEAPKSEAPPVDTSWDGIDDYTPGSNYNQNYNPEDGYTNPIGDENDDEWQVSTPGNSYDTEYNPEDGYTGTIESPPELTTPSPSYGVEYDPEKGYGGELPSNPSSNYGLEYDPDTGYTPSPSPSVPLNPDSDDQQPEDTLPLLNQEGPPPDAKSAYENRIEALMRTRGHTRAEAEGNQASALSNKADYNNDGAVTDDEWTKLMTSQGKTWSKEGGWQ